MKKRLLSIILTVCMVLSLLPGYTITAMAAGEGTGNPAAGAFTLNTSGANIITNADQLAYVAQQIKNKIYGWGTASYKLGNDINLTAYSNWTPIGHTDSLFEGIFDGGGHTISNLKINTTGSGCYGLFGDINNGTVKNAGLSGVNINVTSAADFLYVGGLAGRTDGTITNCFVTGTVSGTVTHTSAYFGGLAGRNYHGTMNNCYTTATVSVTGSGSYSVGGMAGKDDPGYISNCYWLSAATAAGVGSGSKTGTGNCSFTGTNTLASPVTIGGTNTSSLLDALNAWLNNEAKTDLYTWVSSGSYPVFGSLWAPPTYTATVTVNKDGSPWSGSSKSFSLYQSGTKKYDLTLSGSSAAAAALAGTYDVYESTVDTGVNIVVSSGGGNAATINYYTLALSAGAGTTSPIGSGVYLPGKSVAINATVNTGYVWSKWTSSNTALLSDQMARTTSITMPVAPISLTATAAPDEYSITYQLNGGTVSTANPNSYTINSNAISLTNPTRTGYTFAGWSGSNGATAETSVTIPTGSTGAKEYTANWTTDTYTIGYSLNGGTVATANPNSYTINSNAISLTNPTRTGYTFAGWTGSNGATAQINVSIPTGSTGNKSYTANWTADSYNITYQLNGGNVSIANPVSYTSDSGTITLNNPTRDGYSFIGWSGTDLTGNTNQSVTIATNSTGAKAYAANWKANMPAKLDASVVTKKTSTTLTISTTVDYEYSLDNGEHWYSGTNGSYTFNDLNSGQSYNLICRKTAATTEGSVSTVSDPSPALSVTMKNGAPEAPTLAFDAITENSVKITAVEGAEYSKDDGVNWQNSNEFADLEAATKYNFAIRIKETGDAIAGTKASVEKYTTLPTSKAGTAIYDDMTQAVATDEAVIEAAIKATATTAVNDNSIVVTIKKVSYAEPVAGTSANPTGTNGSYKFTVTLSKNGQTDETTEKTIVISSTAFTGVSDVNAVDAAKTAIKDGTVTVAFNADQTAKTAAVQSYVDGLLTGDAAGVTATVTFNSEPGKYDVVIEKGSVRESTSITMTIKEDADPDIETVNNAQNAADKAKYVDMTQVDATDETAIQDALKATAESAVKDNTVNITVTKESYTAPIAGTSGNPTGTNGSYVFKITVSKGLRTLVTAQKTITIAATPYAEIPTYKIIGIVQDGNSSNVQDATVKLMHGQNQVGLSVQTDADGKFTMENVINGTYNLVVNKNGITVTSLVVVNNTNSMLESAIILPNGKTNSVVEVKPSTPPIVVGGLDKQFQATATETDKGVTSNDNDVVTKGGSVEIKLIAEKKDNTATNAADISATATSDGKTVGIFVDLSVLKTVKDSSGDEISSQSAILTELPSLIEVLIPLDSSYQGRSSYVVYRYHGASVDTITTTAKDGEKIELINNGTTIKLTVKKFSTYAIAYTTPSTPTNNNGSGSGGGHNSSSVVASTITAETSEGGKITISTDKKTATLIPDDGYVIADAFLDGKGIGATEKYTFTDSKTHKMKAVFVKRSALAYYNQGNQKIYIGFSAISGNLYKYVAPTGVTVEFKENPKTFTDNTIVWAKPSIDFVTEREIFLGKTQDQFGPNESMTRAMFVTAIGRLYERSYGSISGTSNFSDVNPNEYYAKYVAWANDNGIIKGMGENQFAPTEKVTREQMAVIMFNFAKFLKKADIIDSSLAYTDSASISTWAIDGASYCQKTKVITGREGGSFMPQGNATRAEVAAVMERFVKTIVE